MAMLEACDGHRTIEELLATMAKGVGASADAIAPGVARLVQKLLRAGLLTASP